MPRARCVGVAGTEGEDARGRHRACAGPRRSVIARSLEHLSENTATLLDPALLEPRALRRRAQLAGLIRAVPRPMSFAAHGGRIFPSKHSIRDREEPSRWRFGLACASVPTATWLQ